MGKIGEFHKLTSMCCCAISLAVLKVFETERVKADGKLNVAGTDNVRDGKVAQFGTPVAGIFNQLHKLYSTKAS